jgi:integrase
MNVSNLQKRHPLLMGYLEDNGYSTCQKNWFNRCIKLVVNEGACTKIKSYEQLYLQEVKHRGYKRDAPVRVRLKSVLGSVKQFDLDGIYPQRNKPKGFMASVKKYDLLISNFRAIIDNYEQTAKRGTKTSKTIHAERGAAIQFFIHIQNAGARSITEITERSVLDFFFDGEKIIRGKDYKDKIVPVLHTAEGLYGEAIEELLSYFPNLQKIHLNYPYLTKEECLKLQNVLSNESPNLTLLDRAIATVAYYTGLRGTDITSLTFENIDWEQATINLIQSKTGEELSLPMSTIVGNAIWDYVTKARPESKEQFIFVTSGKPHIKISNTWWHLKKVFDEAGIRKDGGRTGVRIFRHHLATTLLGNEIQAPIISSILGHTAPESINPYVDADVEHLKKCSISITDYPILKEVFEL